VAPKQPIAELLDSSFERDPFERILLGTKAKKHETRHDQLRAEEKLAKVFIFRK
jgi:hypothetical protein